jgi:glycosyltransferase involved in cell wall biosynthesis
VHLIALVEHPNHVCCRYRVAAFEPALRRAGHSIQLEVLPRGIWQRLRLYRVLRGQNVLVQRKLLPSWERLVLRRSVRRLLFDFDDAVYLRDSYSPRGLHHPGRLRRFAGLVRACDAVIAGNDHLAMVARRFAPPDRVHVIPTCVAPERYPLAEHARSGAGVALVWIGSASTLQGMSAIAPMLEEIGRRVPGLHLRLVCDRFLRIANLTIDEVPWAEATEGKAIAGADIGISWVPEDAWSEGKCGLKILQYMAAGLPVVTNPVGVHVEMVRDGATGFLARTVEDWVSAIARLAGDTDLRRTLGTAGRRRLEAEYSVAAGAGRWLRLLDRLESAHARAG